ncbi:hypothetical protein M0802_004552 [Mischocyttarus mexicanus]|nr:hypothetical protein M0802_004552 [Mischocyttarus mexicanus]
MIYPISLTVSLLDTKQKRQGTNNRVPEDDDDDDDDSPRPARFSPLNTGKTLFDHQCNDDIRKECNIQDIVRWARQRRRGWEDHIARMENNQVPKIAQTQKLNTNRLPERPPKRWHENWTFASQE